MFLAVVGRGVCWRWQPLQLRWLKLNSDVTVRLNGSYIAISFRDSFSSLYMTYTKRLVAINPFVGKISALADVTILV